MISKKLLKEWVKEIILEQQEDVATSSERQDFRNQIKSAVESIDSEALSKIKFASNNWIQAAQRGHNPPGTKSAPVAGIQVSIPPEAGFSKEQLMSALESVFGSQNIGPLEKGVYRAKYGTSKINYGGKNFYLTVDDKKGDSSNIETGQNLGKAAEFALQAAMESLTSGGDLNTYIDKAYEEFLETTNPEGPKVKAASKDKQESFKEKFDQFALSSLETLRSTGLNFSGAKVDSSRDAIADIQTDDAHVHVKYGSSRLGGIHRAKDIARPEIGNINAAIKSETSTDVLDRALQNLIDLESDPEFKDLKKKEKKVLWIRDNRRKELMDLLNSYGYMDLLAQDITDLLATGNIDQKKTYYVTFSKGRDGQMSSKIDLIDIAETPVSALINKPGADGTPSTSYFFKIVNQEKIGDVSPGEAELMQVEIRTDRKPQMHRGKDFNLLFKPIVKSIKESRIKELVQKILRKTI
jgi:hypothetical protein